MKRATLERNLVVVLFILVLVVFSFADRASKRYMERELSTTQQAPAKESLAATAGQSLLPAN